MSPAEASSLATSGVCTCRSLTLTWPLRLVQVAPSSMAAARTMTTFLSSSPVAQRLRTMLEPLLLSRVKSNGIHWTPHTSCSVHSGVLYYLCLQPQRDIGTWKGGLYQLLLRLTCGYPLPSCCVWDSWSLLMCHLLGPWGPQTCL